MLVQWLEQVARRVSWRSEDQISGCRALLDAVWFQAAGDRGERVAPLTTGVFFFLAAPANLRVALLPLEQTSARREVSGTGTACRLSAREADEACQHAQAVQHKNRVQRSLRACDLFQSRHHVG